MCEAIDFSGLAQVGHAGPGRAQAMQCSMGKGLQGGGGPAWCCNFAARICWQEMRGELHLGLSNFSCEIGLTRTIVTAILEPVPKDSNK